MQCPRELKDYWLKNLKSNQSYRKRRQTERVAVVEHLMMIDYKLIKMNNNSLNIKKRKNHDSESDEELLEDFSLSALVRHGEE